MNKYIENVSHLKKKLEKGVGYEKTLHILHKLQKIPITIDLLHETGIGKTVRNLSKKNGDTDIGKTAKLLCLTWKAIVKEQQQQEERETNNSHEESPIVKEEPNCDDSFISSANSSYEKSEQKDLNRSDDEDLNHCVGSSESDFNSDKRRNGSEDTKADKKHKKHKSSNKSKESESMVSSKTEFETLLGLNDQIIRNNKKSPNKKSESERFSKKSSHLNTTSDKSCVKTETIESNETKYSPNGYPVIHDFDSKLGIKSVDHSDILSSLPTPHYKPHINRDLIDERIESNRKKIIKANEELSISIQSRKGRTAVFAGNARTKTYTHVPKLEDLCIQVLMDNFDKICYLADAPYYLMKPVLQKCNPKQLGRIEKLNPQILDETDELWNEFCVKEFRGKEPDEDEDETWRDLYFRCVRERESRLKNITKNISHKQAKALPVRQTQFSENVKTPREILRKQERSGINTNTFSGPKSGYSGSPSSNNAHVKIVADKPKVAPLMKKALKLQRARYRK